MFEGLEGFVAIMLASFITLAAVAIVFLINFLPFVSISVGWALLMFPISAYILSKVFK
jgi:hypothetical protein